MMLEVRGADRPVKRKSKWKAICSGIAVGAFVLAVAIYYVFSVNQVPTFADKGGAPATVGQGAKER